MNINLLINQIILHELDVPRSQRPQIQAAIAEELTRLMTQKGLPADWQAGGTIPNLSVNLTTNDSTHPIQLGKQIAHLVYNKLQPQQVT
jgi:hypothetical protein